MTKNTLLTAMMMCSVLAGCGGEGLEPVEIEELATVEQAVASDPSTSSVYQPCTDDFTHGGTTGRIYWPKNGTCNQSVFSPLVVIVHARGNSFSFDDYDYLQDHLARNGFISVSVEVGFDNQAQAATKAWNFVEDFVWSTWSLSPYVNPASISLIGHSRGGASVRTIARSLRDDELFNVRSVVTFAPVSEGVDLDGLDTGGYLQIYGTGDTETPPSGVFWRYDLAGNDGSQEPADSDDEILYKSLKFVEGVPHVRYCDGSPAENALVKGWVLAYLAAHNKDNVTWYEDYIRSNDHHPGGWADDVYTSYSDGFYRRVIDNFDDGAIAGTNIGGVLSTFQATAQVIAPAWPHTGDVLWMWGSSTEGTVSWTIPAAQGNATAFKWLSLRIAQLSGAPANDLRIQIRNNGVWSSEVRLTTYGEISTPLETCHIGGCSTQGHMSTIRVPLSAFGARNDVEHVRLRFRGDSTIDTFMVDNLEFSEWVFKP